MLLLLLQAVLALSGVCMLGLLWAGGMFTMRVRQSMRSGLQW